MRIHMLTKSQKTRRRLRAVRKYKRKLMAIYGRKCASCGKKGELTVDHKTPLSRGGSNTIDNLQLLCPDCNVEKDDMTVEEYRMMKRIIRSDR